MENKKLILDMENKEIKIEIDNEITKLRRILEAQKKISNINYVINRLYEKISNLTAIKDKDSFIIKEELTKDRNDYKYCNLTYASLIERRPIIAEIYLYNHPYKVEAEDYIMGIFGANDDIFSGNEILVKKDDPLWDVLIEKYIKYLEKQIEIRKNKIEEIKLKLKGEENESK